MMVPNYFLDFAAEPICDRRGEPTGWAELLLRPSIESKAFSPSDFFSRFNADSLPQLEFEVFQAAVKYAHHNQIEKISINLSPHSLMSEYFQHQLLRLILRKIIDARQLCVEITEEFPLQSSGKMLDFLSQLKKEGALIALDDFGSGSAHWSLLQNDLIELIKIPAQSLQSMPQKQKTRFIQAINAFAKAMDIITVLEGISNTDDFDQGRDMGFHFFQGWHFCQPPRSSHKPPACA